MRIVKRTTRNEAHRREFPVSMVQFPVRAEKFRAPNRTGILPQRMVITEQIDANLTEKGPKMVGIRKIPCYFPCWQGIGTCSNSAESGLLEVIIGLDDLAQLVFRGAIPAIGVGGDGVSPAP